MLIIITIATLSENDPYGDLSLHYRDGLLVGFYFSMDSAWPASVRDWMLRHIDVSYSPDIAPKWRSLKDKQDRQKFIVVTREVP